LSGRKAAGLPQFDRREGHDRELLNQPPTASALSQWTCLRTTIHVIDGHPVSLYLGIVTSAPHHFETRPKRHVKLNSVRIGMLAAWMLAGTLALLPHDPTAQPATIDERGVAFPVTLTPPGGGPPHRLTGTATRERTIFKVDVYAYGLYLEPEAARAQLAAFAGRPAAVIDRDRSFYARVLELRIPMLLRLVTTRDLTGDQLGDAFDEALKPRVARAAAELKMPGGDAALARFRGYFNLGQLAHGTTIVFACREARLTTSVNAELRPPLVSPALCWALFDTYFGDRAISAEGRRRLVAGVPALLARAPRLEARSARRRDR
jgi:hypothetical protein